MSGLSTGEKLGEPCLIGLETVVLCLIFCSKIPGIIVVSSGMTFTFSSEVNLARVD